MKSGRQQQPKALKLIGPYGEALMQRYLEWHGIPFVREPSLPQTSRKIDFEVRSEDGSRVFIEVKTIWEQPPRSASAADFHQPIRKHIAAAARQFSLLPDTVNVIAFAVFPGSFVDIDSPRIMLGAMYGDLSLSIPFSTTTSSADLDRVEWGFALGKGEMVRKRDGGVEPRHSRIAALLSLHDNSSFAPAFGDRESLPFGELAKQATRYASSAESEPFVTVWENAGARSSVPADLFKGTMDARWGVSGSHQVLTFEGEARQARSALRRNEGHIS